MPGANSLICCPAAARPAPGCGADCLAWTINSGFAAAQAVASVSVVVRTGALAEDNATTQAVQINICFIWQALGSAR